MLESLFANTLSSDTSECCGNNEQLTVIGYGTEYEGGSGILILY